MLRTFFVLFFLLSQNIFASPPADQEKDKFPLYEIINTIEHELRYQHTKKQVNEAYVKLYEAYNILKDKKPEPETLAKLKFNHSNPFDLGDISKGPRTFLLEVVNTGNQNATDITPELTDGRIQFKGGGYPGVGGNCTFTLSKGSSCQMVLVFNADKTGTLSEDFRLNYNDGLNDSASAEITVSATVITPALLTISDGPNFDFSDVAIGGQASHIFTIVNSGAGAATNMSGSGLVRPFEFSGGTYPGTGGNCTTTLSAGNSCTVEVTFQPTGSGMQVETLEIIYDSGVAAQIASRELTGTGVTPAVLAISGPNPFDFGVHAIGSTIIHTFTVSNAGGSPAQSITSSLNTNYGFHFEGGSYPGTGGTCPLFGALSAGSTCDIVIEFQPKKETFYSTTLFLDYDDGVVIQSIALDLQGTGTGPAYLTISEFDPFDFGTITTGSIAEHTFTLTNSGSSAATSLVEIGLALPFSFKDGVFPGTGGDCGQSLSGSGSTCNVVVQFEPSLAGVQAETIVISYFNGSTTVNTTRDLIGTGIQPANLSISEVDPFNFGTVPVGGSTEHTFTLTNNGSSPATAISVSGLVPPFFFKGGGYPGTGGDCSSSLAGNGGKCTLVVEFAPTSTGLMFDTLDIHYYNGVTAATTSRSVQGTATVSALLTISESDPYNFGSVTVNSTTTHIFTITNTGGYAALAISETGLSAPFSFTGGSYPGTLGTCTTTLSPGATCTISVEYAPTGSSLSDSDSITLNYNDGAAAQTATRDIVGSAIAPATLTIIPSPIDFGKVPVDSNISHKRTLTITNEGESQAVLIDGLFTNNDFQFEGGTFPGTGGTCIAGGALGSSTSCTIVLSFQPSIAVKYSEDLTVSYYDGVFSNNVTADLLGQGIISTPPVSPGRWAWELAGIPMGSRSLDNTPLLQASSIPAHQQDFELRIYENSSCTIISQGAIITGSTVSLSFRYENDGSDDGHKVFYAQVADSSGNLSTCDYVAHYYLDTNNVPAVLSISDGPRYDYGSVQIGQTEGHLFTIAHSGDSPAKIKKVYFEGTGFSFTGGEFPGTGGTCSKKKITATCTISVEFSPDEAKSYLDTIKIDYTSQNKSLTVQRDITGVGYKEVKQASN